MLILCMPWLLSRLGMIEAAFDRSTDSVLVHLQDEGDKVIVVERGDLVLVFNFHPTQSYSDYRVGCMNPGAYKVNPPPPPPLPPRRPCPLSIVPFAVANSMLLVPILHGYSESDCDICCSLAMMLQLVLSSDEECFGGWENISKKYDAEYTTEEGDYDNRPHSFQVRIEMTQLF